LSSTKKIDLVSNYTAISCSRAITAHDQYCPTLFVNVNGVGEGFVFIARPLAYACRAQCYFTNSVRLYNVIMYL